MPQGAISYAGDAEGQRCCRRRGKSISHVLGRMRSSCTFGTFIPGSIVYPRSTLRPSGGANVKLCSRAAAKEKSSMRARASPRQLRRPEGGDGRAVAGSGEACQGAAPWPVAPKTQVEGLVLIDMSRKGDTSNMSAREAWKLTLYSIKI